MTDGPRTYHTRPMPDEEQAAVPPFPPADLAEEQAIASLRPARLAEAVGQPALVGGLGIATRATEVYLMVAGIPIELKSLAIHPWQQQPGGV